MRLIYSFLCTEILLQTLLPVAICLLYYLCIAFWNCVDVAYSYIAGNFICGPRFFFTGYCKRLDHYVTEKTRQLYKIHEFLYEILTISRIYYLALRHRPSMYFSTHVVIRSFSGLLNPSPVKKKKSYLLSRPRGKKKAFMQNMKPR